nr:DUF1249 domain-containing protein [Shewanella salipaludis]
MALCGRNYGHILKWLPLQLSLDSPCMVEGAFGVLMVRVLENTKYTQLVEISRQLPDSAFFAPPRVQVRVYHDAKLAEVLTGQQIYLLRPVYDYPNQHMHHSDEKYRVNAFLEELLKIGCRPRVCQS